MSSLKDSDPLVSNELVDAINSDPKATFHAKVYPHLAKLTIGDAKKFLSPVRPIPTEGNRGSAVPVGANENWMHDLDKNFITGFSNQVLGDQKEKSFNAGAAITNVHVKFPIFDVTKLCSSWAPAVTSAMSISVSRWNNVAGSQQKFINFSLQYIIDCDLLGDACVERTPLSAYQIFWTKHIPASDGWDDPGQLNSERHALGPLSPPVSGLSCDDCYPGTTNCGFHYALTGSCDNNAPPTGCPVYMLYNWRWMKSHLYEVGAITSSIICHASLFTYYPSDSNLIAGSYEKTIYSRNIYNPAKDDILGMLDVTIIGWGQTFLNLSSKPESTYSEKFRWWWVIPHLGCTFGVSLPVGSGTLDNENYIYPGSGTPNLFTTGNFNYCAHDVTPISSSGGFIKFNRRFDDCNIESHSVGAVPFNFVPAPYRSPEITP